MPEWIWPVLILVAIAAVVVFFVLRRKKKKVELAWTRSTLDRAKKIAATKTPYVSPDGITFYFENDLKHSQFYDLAVKAGIEYTFRKMRECDKPYPNLNIPLSDVTVIVFEAERSESGDPCFRVAIWPGDPYWNSQWDKMKGQTTSPHYVLAAGQTISVGAEGLKNCFVIGAHTIGDIVSLETVSGYEAEHFALAYVDGPRFDDTIYHVTKGHPIIDGSCLPSAVGFHRNHEKEMVCVGTKGLRPVRNI